MAGRVSFWSRRRRRRENGSWRLSSRERTKATCPDSGGLSCFSFGRFRNGSSRGCDGNRRSRLLGTCAFRRTGSRLAQRGSTASLVPRALSLPRRAPPPLWETSRAATGAEHAGTPRALRSLAARHLFVISLSKKWRATLALGGVIAGLFGAWIVQPLKNEPLLALCYGLSAVLLATGVGLPP